MWKIVCAISHWIQSWCDSSCSHRILNPKRNAIEVADILFIKLQLPSTQSQWLVTISEQTHADLDICNTVNVNTTMLHVEYNLDAILFILVAFWMQTAMQLKPQIFYIAISFSAVTISIQMHAENVTMRMWTMLGAISLWIQSRCNSFHSRCILNAKVADIATTFNTVTISETNSRWATLWMWTQQCFILNTILMQFFPFSLHSECKMRCNSIEAANVLFTNLVFSFKLQPTLNLPWLQ